MMARKLLELHTEEKDAHAISQIIETLKSNLFFHGHPINRKEAKAHLKLKIVEPPVELESLMWQLYQEYACAMHLDEPFQPLHELEKAKKAVATTQGPTTQDIVREMMQLASVGVSLQNVTPEQLVKLAGAVVSFKSVGDAANRVELKAVEGAYVESPKFADVFKTDMVISRSMVTTQSGPQDALRHEILWNRWERESC
jgi:hypothetical protein